MKRLMVQPTQFGANQGYTWNSQDDVDGIPGIEAHHDYCNLYRHDYSVRIWEPGRMKYSSPGIYGGSDAQLQVAPELPMTATIHGIKGALYFRFDGSYDGVGTWFDDNGEPFDSQPTYVDTYKALSGIPGASEAPTQPGLGYLDCNPAFKMPLFVTLYRGTYKQIDVNVGWEIDSGPSDDPDTLLSLDISNPQVLESSRIDWWDMDMVRLPHYSIDASLSHASPGSDGLGIIAPDSPVYSKTYKPGSALLHKYSLDLSQNHRLGPDQVLWLHLRTGCIRLPVLFRPATGDPYVACAYYKAHAFSVSVQASMLVSTRVAS